tara:strand:- start:613 stop:834 length:222 start_codon:yes stop_codon:yes gene_type:complete
MLSKQLTLNKIRIFPINGFILLGTLNILIKKIKRLRYITPQIENVKPAGVNKLSNKSDTSPVVRPPIGRAFAK